MEPVTVIDRTSRPQRARVVIGVVVVAAAIVFLLTQLGNATTYFKTADEAVRDRASLGSSRFRIEGAVVEGSVRRAGDDVRFTIEENRVTVPVRHRGDPPDLFKPGIPVVLEGRFEGNTFVSDRIMVKHSDTYRAKHPERTKSYPESP